MPSLLCTLGTSWAVVPEAFILGNGSEGYRNVFVITTSGDATRAAREKTQAWFKEQAPGTYLRILAIEHLADLADSRDHQTFEEALFRAYFALLAMDDDVHVCLAGGFKTMSASAQEAAGLIGCDKLFHILAEPIGTTRPDGSPGFKFPDTPEEIKTAISTEKVKLISLGSRAGWPTIRELATEAEPLPAAGEPFLVEGFSLSNAIHHRIEAANRLAASEPELARLPFPQLARWSPGERAALDRPLDPDPQGADAAWVLSLPKIELHCHLGGFATHGELLENVRAAATHPDQLPSAVAPEPRAGWPLPATTVSLGDYMKLGDANGSALLKDSGCLRRQCELLYQHLRSQNIVHAEIRCSPGNYATTERSSWTVLAEIKTAFDSCMAAAPGCHVNLIIIATRKDGGDRSDISRHLGLAITAAQHWTSGCSVIGVDLAGFENKDTRAALFATDFEAIHRVGLAVTIHAGENDDAEGIWQAVFKLNARRIGHALHLIDAPDLLRSVADRSIGLEMCPYANQQIKGFQPLPGKPDYPLGHYLEAGVRVTVNTDNIGISAASLTDNFLLLAHLCPGITRLEILRLLRNAVDQAFLHAAGRQRLLEQIHIPKCP